MLIPAWMLYLAVAAGIILSAAAHAQDVKGRKCSKCKTKGKIENPFMTPSITSMEEKALFCSYVIANDKKGHGISWIPCFRCRNPVLGERAEREFDTLVAAKTKWLDARLKAEEKLEMELTFVETEHFIIAWDIPKIVTKDKKTYKLHAALHLYAERLEAFFNDFMSFLRIDEKELRNKKHRIYLFERQKHCLKAGREYTGLNCWNAAKLPGNPSILVSWYDRGNMRTEEDFHRHLVHHISHLLNVSYYRMEWLAARAGWADEGLGHFFEYKYFGRADNTCDEEGEEEELSHSDWEYQVRQGVAAGKGPSFSEICSKSTTALHGRDHQLAWSYIDFLMKKKDPGLFKVFMKVIKQKKDCRDAVKEAYSLNVITFQKEWEEYVLEKYRKKPLPTVRRNRRR